MKSGAEFSLLLHSSKRPVSLALLVSLIIAFFPPVFLPQVSALPTGYRDRGTLLQDFFNLMNQYPTLMTYESIGKSYEGMDIPMFKIGNPNGGKVLFTMVTHGDEVEGAEVGYYMAEWILERKEPAIADRILQGNLIMIVIVNIDSYGIKRKNMDQYGFVQGAYANSYGVDLNRNMPVGWGGSDSSSNVTDMSYKGPSPGSEPESQALINLFETYKPKFHLNYHYGGGMVFAKPSANAKMTTSMSQYHDAVATEIKALAVSRGVNVYGYGQLGISGCITDQAYVSGNSTSYLLEAGNWINWTAPPYGQMQSVLLPRLLPFLIVFAQESEVVQNHFDGSFESGNFSAWTGTYVSSGETATVVKTLAYEGNFSAKFTSDGTSLFEAAYCFESVPVSSNFRSSGYFYVSQSGITENNDRFYLIRFTAGGNDVAYAGWRRVGGVDRWELLIWDATGWVSDYSNASPSLNNWYGLELNWTEDAVKGHGELYIDGALACSIQNQNTSAFGGVDQVRFGLAEVYGSGASTVYADLCQTMMTWPWDLNQDGKVDGKDIAIVALVFGSVPGSPNWNPLADLNADGKVDGKDITAVAIHYGEHA